MKAILPAEAARPLNFQAVAQARPNADAPLPLALHDLSTQEERH
ncbi:MAG: hypothetical protein ABII76_04785 [Pseudomonadota bacterium]|jgi:hypothetical protein|nr:hypothetical protein [Xanthobacteraceae bacterium]